MNGQDQPLSQYRIIRRLGTGGMAEVFLADKVGAAGFSRSVAIKTILAHGAPADAISLFLDEARVASALHHSAIVQTLDLGLENETLYIVMEYVAGPPLSRLIFETRRMGRFLPAHLVAYVGARIASALDYAHRRVLAPDGRTLNLIHRDVSPQNILVTRTGIVKLTDFGVARASIQTHHTKTGQVRGKAAYMAPEQVRAKPLDGRTDMFALGLVLYEALTGVRAYHRPSDIESMRAVLSDKVQPIHETNPAVPGDLVDVIMRALEKKPQNRFEHCGAFEAALAESMRSVPTATIEAEIAEWMEDVFGPEKFVTSDEPQIEPWQPTISVNMGGAVSVPKLNRLRGASLSPEVAALLSPVARTPEEPVISAYEATPRSSPRPSASPPATTPLERGATQPPKGRQATTKTPSIAPPAMPGYSAVSSAPPRPSWPSHAPVGSPTDPAAAAQRARRRRNEVAAAAAAVALVLSGAVLFSAARSSSHKRPSTPPTSSTPVASPPAPRPVELPAAVNAPTPDRAAEAPPESPPRVDPIKVVNQRRPQNRAVPPPVPEKTGTTEKTDSRPPESDGEFMRRVLELSQKAERAEKFDLKQKLDFLMVDLMQNGKATLRDRELVDEADRALD